MPLQSDKLRLLRRIPDIRFDEESPGFSKDQVNRVLANLAPLAAEIERLQNRLTEAENRATAAESRLVEARTPSEPGVSPPPPTPLPDFDETLRNTLVSAQRQADLTIREATEEAERLRTEAEFQSNALLADARDQSAEMTTEAVAYRERLMAEAVEERAQRLEEARAEADGLIAEVERELIDANEAERSRLIAQIEELQAKHRQLEDDVERFEAHLRSRSDEVRESVVRILAVLDEPELLRTDSPFESAEIEEIDPDLYSEISVAVPARDKLAVKAEIAAESVNAPREAVDVEAFDQLSASDDEAAVSEPIVADALNVDETSLDESSLDETSLDETSLDETQVGIALDFDDHPGTVTEELATPEDPATEGTATDKILEDDEEVQVVEAPALSRPIFTDDSESDIFDSADSWAQNSSSDKDRYAEELRRATSEEAGDDAIADFLEDKPDRSGGGWFGRRR